MYSGVGVGVCRPSAGCTETSFDFGAAFASANEEDEEGSEEENDERCANYTT